MKLSLSFYAFLFLLSSISFMLLLFVLSSFFTSLISSTAFKMYLNKNLVEAIEENIRPVVTDFLINEIDATDYWAIHPAPHRLWWQAPPSRVVRPLVPPSDQ